MTFLVDPWPVLVTLHLDDGTLEAVGANWLKGAKVKVGDVHAPSHLHDAGRGQLAVASGDRAGGVSIGQASQGRAEQNGEEGGRHPH